jgi:L-serine dehydratase
MRADHISPLDMFKIGVGPSSSHTVGPMVAALAFRESALAWLKKAKPGNYAMVVELYGSLSLTGQGHQTDGAVCAGLAGLNPKSSQVADIWGAMGKLEAEETLDFGSKVKFKPSQDIKWYAWTFNGESLPHPNTMRFCLMQESEPVLSEVILSVGGGFIEKLADTKDLAADSLKESRFKALPYPYNSAAEFVEQVETSGKQPWELVIANQEALGLSEASLRERLSEILQVFENCIESGLKAEGILPGGLNVRRRAKSLYEKIMAGKESSWSSGLGLKPSVYAIAVNEENAAGGRVVTAPTNGSSGLIPAVFRTLKESRDLSHETLQNGLIVASVVGALVKVHASISGAEVGCQGEVGTSCAMAAAGATAMLGGTVRQIEQAAEIGIEHHLGMTCDPIKGLVQVPCIERNAMGAVKALNAAELSLAGDGQHMISLDKALLVMKQTGLDMNQKYKETATGGLALG